MPNTEKIRELNDRLRVQGAGGRIMVTSGVVNNPLAPQILEKVRAFDQFTEDNDPHTEHDFGAFEFSGATFFWKIDYYDKSLTHGSADPSDPVQTERVLTVMLAEEY